MKDHATYDYRGIDRETGERMTWKETLAGMCAYYGTFSGRWHSNDFWKKTAAAVPDMDEAACEAKVRQIQRDADAALEMWRFSQ